MMTNIFSVFDPVTPNFLAMNWLSVGLGVLVLPGVVWNAPARGNQALLKVLNFVYTELSPLAKKAPYALILYAALFVFLLLNNSLGLLPYVFTGSSQLSFTVALALPVWSALMLYGWLNNTSNLLVHLIPQGTPPLLMPLMVVIETTSNLIRPLTLAVRLMANMVAGHLLIVLLNSADPSTPFPLTPLLFLLKQVLLLLELAVAVVQAYVFSVLVTLYAAEFSV